MRKVISTYISRHGNPVAIYSTYGTIFRSKDIELGATYELAYKLGRGDAYLKAELIMVTENNRTLFFKNPDDEDKLIGIPTMNIIKYYKK